MAEPARKTPTEETGTPAEEPLEDEVPLFLQRWVERPDGRFELLELPLTPELFLDPQLEDKMPQGRLHSDLMASFKETLRVHFIARPDIMILMDVKHLLGPGLPGPSPDISVIQGARNPERDRSSFNLRAEGVTPCLILEIVSPLSARIRKVDEEDKVALYERVGVREYLIVNPPRKATGYRFRITGYRLDAKRRYRPIEPDERGRLRSETTGLLFGVSPQGDRIEIFDAETGEPLRSHEEDREAAEAEIGRLKAEIEQLKKLKK